MAVKVRLIRLFAIKPFTNQRLVDYLKINFNHALDKT